MQFALERLLSRLTTLPLRDPISAHPSHVLSLYFLMYFSIEQDGVVRYSSVFLISTLPYREVFSITGLSLYRATGTSKAASWTEG